MKVDRLLVNTAQFLPINKLKSGMLGIIKVQISTYPPASVAYMRQRIGAALVQIMACAYSAPSHYINRCWAIVNWNLMNKLQGNFNQTTKFFLHEIASGNIVCETVAIFARESWVNTVILTVPRKNHAHDTSILASISQPQPQFRD